MSAVGVIGVGQMGLAMALRLHELGHWVVVRDVDPAREALAPQCARAPSAAALAREVEVAIVAVVDAPQVQEVLFGAEGLVRGGPDGRLQAVLLCSTIGAQDCEDIAARLHAEGLPMLEAPMSGGPQRARQGTMSLMVAAPRTLFDTWQPLLHDLAHPVLHISQRPGDAMRTKLVNNLLATINLAGAAEAMALAQSLGLDGPRTLEVIAHSSGQSWIGSERLQRALAGDVAVRAQLALLAKDSALALQLGPGMPVSEAAARWFAQAVAEGWGPRDDAELLAFIRGRFFPGDTSSLA